MGLFDALTKIAGSVITQKTQQTKQAETETNWLDTLSKVAAAASAASGNNNASSSNGGGILDGLQDIANKATMVAAAKDILDGKINLQTIGSLLTAYFNSQGNSKKEASTQGTSIAKSIADAVNLDSIKNVTDLVGSLNKSDKPGTTDMATIVTSAITSFLTKK